jgi:hypothetical protein
MNRKALADRNVELAAINAELVAAAKAALPILLDDMKDGYERSDGADKHAVSLIRAAIASATKSPPVGGLTITEELDLAIKEVMQIATTGEDISRSAIESALERFAVRLQNAWTDAAIARIEGT